MNIRPFDDLIKPIEYDGKTFVPIEEIAKMAIAPILREKVEFSKPKMSNSEIEYVGVKVKYEDGWRKVVQIWGNFDTIVWLNNSHFLVHNQVQIVKNLIKWGFIEP